MNAPVCLDAERRVLGSLIAFYQPSLLARVKATGLKPADFWYRSHEAVYRAVLRLDLAGEHVNDLTVGRFLAGQRHSRDGNWLDAVGGQAKVEELAGCADLNGCVPCARMVVEDSRWRRWLDATYEALEAIETRDEKTFWRVISGVRSDAPEVEPRHLRAIEGEAA